MDDISSYGVQGRLHTEDFEFVQESEKKKKKIKIKEGFKYRWHWYILQILYHMIISWDIWYDIYPIIPVSILPILLTFLAIYSKLLI